MRLNYKRLGDYIQPINQRNINLEVETLLGVSIRKVLMPSIANTIGTDMSRYKIIKKNQFAYGPVTSRNGDKISIALLEEYDKALVSQAYTVFEIIDDEDLNAEYLMMWFRRPEFDRYARFKSHGSARETFDWEELEETELPIPSIEKQREIVAEYNTIVNRISLNETLNQKLEDTAQALYKHWFVDFEFPITKESCPELVSGAPELEGKPYKSSGGEMVYNAELDCEIPLGWEDGNLIDISQITMGQSPSGESYNVDGVGEIFYQGRTDFGFRFPNVRNYTTEPKRRAKRGNILMSVRAPVGDLNIANNDCCIGRGLSALDSLDNCNSFLYYLMLSVRNQFDVANGEGTIFGSITKDGLHEIKILKPKITLIKEFENLASKIDSRIENISIEISILNPMKDLLLSKMSKVETKIVEV
ncbi:restriction endonuclease subunit S [uncultured Algibacter sp.]|uniref:restriction endonuclease subunit S n=1 Tax=uncultured Algibacter sp. TaxID=298659 RepID=UPI002625BF6F|nr:restriction endonuclease subunit S [uncultured Algibacter sp.]